MFFGKKKVKVQPKTPQFKTLAEYFFTTTEHFRGYKKVRFTVHGYSELEENNKSIKDIDLVKQPIKFVKIRSDKGVSLQVYMFDKELGFTGDEDLIKAFDDLMIDNVYVKYEDDRIHLLVHYKE